MSDSAFRLPPQLAQEFLPAPLLTRRIDERTESGAPAAQVAVERGVFLGSAQQPRQSRGVADREIAWIILAKQSNRAGDA